ncbi:XTP/dITP diphosphatase [Desulfobacca acetoxidans]
MDVPAVVIATRNAGKIRELRALLAEINLSLLTLADFPECPEVLEDGDTFLANAAKKAQAIAACTGLPALADDSGLEVAALGGRPGVFSARYGADRTAPQPHTDADNYVKLLEEMADIPWEQRRARFVCCIVVAFPGGRQVITEGVCQGFIDFEPKGAGGFGYDPVFWLPQYNRTMAEVGLEVKNQISHRAQALKEMQAILADLLHREPSLFQPATPIGT